MSSDEASRRRAPRQSVEERRAMVIQAAVPLLVEIGPSVTTLQIARAAGISEPTIFRAFADKNELLAACLAEVTDPRHVVGELTAIEPTALLRERLVAVIEVIRAQGERTGAVVNAVSLAGPVRPRHHEALPEEERTRHSESRTSSYQHLHAAVVAVLEPDAATLRSPVADIATLVLAIVLSLGRGGGWNTGIASVTTDGLADLILNGITA
ncbi:MAG TPA: TetR/AcrR family transcriptional regulator [Pseudonocardiaceae bacterium]|jgi:AcrR family transcriptional regulator|nr:TetR/AcrR family transcriptional regulator [Pseudonocardiaceae bacterium]